MRMDTGTDNLAGWDMAMAAQTRLGLTARAQRFHVGGLHVVYDTGSEFWSGNVVDVSESGIFVETVHELDPGMHVMLMPSGNGEDELPFEIRAEVVRCNPYDPEAFCVYPPGLAFRLLDMGSEQFSQVQRFLQLRGVPLQAAQNLPR